ncbi:MAG TPA: hypothetical protein VFW45_10915 [Candidatus Polarisedimenticolia bacterium]|nr:hypothetical protein [Candidatus Polarisedimenticolia bacterium]
MWRHLLGIGAATASFLLSSPVSTLSDPSLEIKDYLPIREAAGGQIKALPPSASPDAQTETPRAIGERSPGAASVPPEISPPISVPAVREASAPPGSAAGAPAQAQLDRIVSIRTVRVAAPPGMPGASEPDLDLDPLDLARMAISVTASRVTEAGQAPYPVFVSGNAGESWERSLGLGPFPIADPGLEFDAGGRLYLSALDASVPGGSRGVVVARSDDGGRSFTHRGFAMDASTSFLFPDGSRHSGCNAGGGPLFDYPKLTADQSARSPFRGAIYLLALAEGFDRNGDGVCEGGAYVIIRTRDGGETWEGGRVFEGMQLHTNRLAVSPDGSITVAQAVDGTGPGGRRPEIRIHRSTDGGATFSSVRAFPAGAALEPSTTWVAADPSDAAKLYVAFEGRVKGGDEIGHVFVIRSIDSGATWQQPVQVDSDDHDGSQSEALRPALAVSASGRLDLAWFDYRHSTPGHLAANRQAGDVYFATSSDGGATWSRNLRLNKVSAPAIFAPGNAFLTLLSQPDRALAAFALDTDANHLYETWLAEIRFR